MALLCLLSVFDGGGHGPARAALRWLRPVLAGRGAGLVGLAVLLSGCGPGPRRDPTEPYPVEITRVSRGARGNNAFAQTVVDRALAAGFASNARFRLAEPGETALRGTFWFDDQTLEDGSRQIELALQVEPPEGLAAEFEKDGLEAFVSLEREAPVADDLAGDLTLGLELAVSVLDARVALASGERHRIASLLSAEDPELVLLALEWTRKQHETSFADDVAALLSHDDDRVAAAAVETLGQIGKSKHVHQILEHLRLADSGHAYRAYDALGALGGPEARAFLRFAADNEDEPDRRVAAQRALERAKSSGPGRNADLSHAPEFAEPSVRGHRQ